MTHWTHRYKFKLKLARHIDRLGTTMTGSVQVSRAHSDGEVHALAKRMSNGLADNSVMVECRLSEVVK